MKTPFFKRAVALILAALMILGTLGYLFSMIAYGAVTIRGNDIIGYKITGKTPVEPDATITLEVRFTISNSNINFDLENDDIEIVLIENSFEHSDSSILKLEKEGGIYTATLADIKYTGNGRTITFSILNKTTGIVCATVTKLLDASKFQEPSSSSGGDTPGDDYDGDNNVATPSLPTDMSYAIRKIYRNADGTNITFNSESSNKIDPTIERNYYVDLVVQFPIFGVSKEDIIENSNSHIKVLVDRGSFRFKNATEPAITVLEQSTTGVQGGVLCYVLLKGLQYTGTGNTLAFTVQNKTSSDEEPYIYEQFSTEVTTCVPYVEPEKTPTVSEPDDPDPAPMEMATPYVIINNYDYGGIITAGETFPLTITLYNTSKNIDVENMMVTITMPEAFMLTSSSNTFYIEELHNEELVTKTVDVTAKANADPQSHNIDISMKYQYVDEKINTRKDNTTQETISIPVVQVDRFQLTGVDVPMEIYVGEESYLSVNFVNKGRSEVYNLSAEISGDIQNPGQQQNLGNLASGATGTADFYITPNGEGVCTGEVLITYEDTNMEEKTASIQWSTNVVDPFGGMDFGGDFGEFDFGMVEDPSLMGGEQKSSLPFIAGGVGIAAVVAALVIRKRIQRKKREAEDADL